MRRGVKHLVAICSAAIVFASAGPAGAFSKLPPSGLRGLVHTGVHVTVAPALISDDEVARIRDAVAAALAARGISVLSEDECQFREDCADLEFEIRLLESKSRSLIAFAVRVYVPQLVRLVRNPQLQFADILATYSDEQLGLVRAEELSSAVQATALTLARSYAVVSRSENQ